MTVSKLFIDSSVWLDYFLNEKNEPKQIIEGDHIILTSVITLFEVRKRLVVLKFSDEKIEAVMQFIKSRGLMIDLSMAAAEQAAKLPLKPRLPAIDSFIYASALQNNAVLVTGDNDFRGLQQVILLK